MDAAAAMEAPETVEATPEAVAVKVDTPAPARFSKARSWDLARAAPAPPRALTLARAQGWWYDAIVGSACPAPALSQPRRCGLP